MAPAQLGSDDAALNGYECNGCSSVSPERIGTDAKQQIAAQYRILAGK